MSRPVPRAYGSGRACLSSPRSDRPFKRFHIERPCAFKAKLNDEISSATGKLLSRATISCILSAKKAFFLWLAGLTGCKSWISYSDAEYFDQSATDARVAHAMREMPYPTLAPCRHAFDPRPDESQIEWRNRALFAFLMIAGARDAAIAWLRPKHIDLVKGVVYQDAGEVRTKNMKTFNTWFLPIDPVYRECFEVWVKYLRDDLLLSHDNPLSPPPEMGFEAGRFAVTGLSLPACTTPGPIREVIKAAFTGAGLSAFAPH